MIPVGWKSLSSVVLADAGVAEERGVVRVPYRLADGTVHAVHCESRKGRRWWEPSGVELIPLGIDQVPGPARREGRLVWVLEGETDLFAARGVVAEWREKPIDMLALPGAGVWKPWFVEYLKGYDAAYVFADGDEAGDRMTARVSESVPWAIRVGLPTGRDVRDVIQLDGADVFERLIIDAEETAFAFAAIKFSPRLEAFPRFCDQAS